MVDRYERILGGLLVLLAETLLAERWNSCQRMRIERKYGYLKDIIGGGCWDLEPGGSDGRYNDDYCCRRRRHGQPREIYRKYREYFIKWYDSKPPRDIGNIIRIALGEYKRSNDWMKTAYYAHQTTGGMSAGNGSLMRCLPVALYYNDVEKNAGD